MDKRLIDPQLNSSEHTLLCYDRPSRCLLNFLSGIFQFLQTYHFILSIIQPQMRVCVHSYAYVRMSHQVLQRLWIHSSSGHITAVSMAANVRRDVGKLNSVNLIVAFDHMVEAVFPVHCNLRQSFLIQEQKPAVAINDFLHRRRFAVLQNSLETSVHILCHRNLSGTSFGFGAFNVNFHTSSLKLMVDIDNPILHIQIADGQSTELGNTHSGVEQDVN